MEGIGEEDLKHPLQHTVLYRERVVTDYLLERYERGISGNYNRGEWWDPSGEFSAIPMSAARGRTIGIYIYI